MNQHSQHRNPDVSSEYHTRGQALARIGDAYGGIPRLFAVGGEPVAAWGIEFPDGSAVTYKPGGGFGTWQSPVSAAAMLGDGTLLYIP